MISNPLDSAVAFLRGCEQQLKGLIGSDVAIAWRVLGL